MTLEQTQEVADQPSVEQTPESTPDSPQADDDQSELPSSSEPLPEQPAYKPDFGYVVLDQKKELPEQVRPLIKSKDDEEYWKTVYRKADGIEHVKSRHEHTKAERDEFRTKFSDLNSKVEKFQHFAKNDFGAFLEAAGVTNDQVFDYVKTQLKLQDASPEERLQHEQSRKFVVQNYELQQQLSQQEQFSRQLAQQQHENNLQLAISGSSNFVNEYEGRLGAGAFRKHVEEYGNTVWATQQKYVSPQEAVEAVASKFKPFFQQQQTSAQSPVSAPTFTPTPSVIPSVGKGRNVSHATSSPKSLDDLRALAKSYEGVDDAY